ncbi:MAG TPA: hypothetical protein VJZ27_19415 [Aggregatilineales bacterium]|nr:hypothetical protein [Aggregatilineales bacterium]
MTTTIAFFGLILLVVLSSLVALPLLTNRRRTLPGDFEATSVETLEEQLHRIVSSVHDLDFDFDTGKVSEADYIEQRKLLIGRGVSTLIRLDDAFEEREDLDREIETLVTAYRRQSA